MGGPKKKIPENINSYGKAVIASMSDFYLSFKMYQSFSKYYRGICVLDERCLSRLFYEYILLLIKRVGYIQH